MNWVVQYLLFLVASEILLAIVFEILYRMMVGREEAGKTNLDTVSLNIFKGVVERATITLGLIAGYPQILILFGAIKIGTRIGEILNNKKLNDYILIGNLISVSVAIGYSLAFSHAKMCLGLN